MQIPVFIYHLGIVSGHTLQGRKHCFLHFDGIMAMFQGVFNLAAPVLVRDIILLGGFPEQGKTEASILGPPEFPSRMSVLPTHGAVPSAAPLS